MILRAIVYGDGTITVGHLQITEFKETPKTISFCSRSSAWLMTPRSFYTIGGIKSVLP